MYIFHSLHLFTSLGICQTFFFEQIDLNFIATFFAVSALKKGGYEIVVNSDKLCENVSI